MSAYVCDPTAGGERQNGWNWAYNMAKMGYNVRVLTSHWGKEAIEATLEQEPLPNLQFEYVEVPGWVEKAYVNTLGVYLRYLTWQQQAYKVAKKLDTVHNFDLVHHVTYGSIQMSSALWKLGKPMIFGPSGGGQFSPEAFKDYFAGDWKTEERRKMVSDLLVRFNPNTKKTARHAELFLTTNWETYHMAEDLGAKNVQLFLDTSLPEHFYPKEAPTYEHRPGQPLKLLWIGSLIPRKGLPLVMEALAQVSEDIPFSLTVLGDGPLKDEVPKWIAQYGLEGKVNYPGRVPWEEVKKAYQEHHVFMFTSLRDSSPAQLLEAMAYGRPIITLNMHGAANQVPESAGIKVSVDNPATTVKELAEAVTFMYENPEKCQEYCRDGHEFSKTQTWPVKTSQIAEEYARITGKPIPRPLSV